MVAVKLVLSHLIICLNVDENKKTMYVWTRYSAAIAPNPTLRQKHGISLFIFTELRRSTHLDTTFAAAETEPSPTFLFATVRLKLQLPITCLSNVTPAQHSKLHDSWSHNPSCYVNYLKPKHSFFALSRSLIFSCHLLNF